MLVEVELTGGVIVPGAAIDEELIAENKEMGIPGVSLFDGEAIDLLPGFRIRTGKHNDRCRIMDTVTLGATSKGEIESALKADEIGKGVVFSIVEDSTNLRNLDPRNGFGPEPTQRKNRRQRGDSPTEREDSSAHHLMGDRWH